MLLSSRVLTDVLLLGSLGLVLAIPALQKMVEPQPACTRAALPVPAFGGYYDRLGAWHTGASIYLGGCFDLSGGWHAEVEVPATAPIPPAATAFPGAVLESAGSNYYAGYGTMADIANGQIAVRGTDGDVKDVSLFDGRVLVCLRQAPPGEPNADVDCDSDSGRPDNGADSHPLRLFSGQHVTFYADGGSHILQAENGQSSLQAAHIEPGLVYNWTFTQPGWYEFVDFAAAGLPRGGRHLFIQVVGDAVAFDNRTFVDTMPGTTLPYRP